MRQGYRYCVSWRWHITAICACICISFSCTGSNTSAVGAMTTWDGRHSIEKIAVHVVYFVPNDRVPLADWRLRVDYLCRRIEEFHAREFGEQSTLTTIVRPEPFISKRSAQQLRNGNADAIFFKTLEETDAGISVVKEPDGAFPIVLALSDINWRPLDDFSRMAPRHDGYRFEGSENERVHVPGAASGGARATYLADAGKGWGLVSADGWRVPYRGSDCVVYHEGVGHAVGLPHPDESDNSVMGLGQYAGWISQSWVTQSQKEKLGWLPPKVSLDRDTDLFSSFVVWVDPVVPRPGQPVSLVLKWPDQQKIKQCFVQVQTSLRGPWVMVPSNDTQIEKKRIELGSFDRASAVSYRIQAKTEDQTDVELWGYFQVRSDPGQSPAPQEVDLADQNEFSAPGEAKEVEEIDLLPFIDPKRDSVNGTWTFQDNESSRILESPKAFGARLEIPFVLPEEYRLTVIAEPLDAPNGLILGQRLAGSRFLVLLGYAEKNNQVSALENIDEQNVATNQTRIEGEVFKRNRLSEIVCTVRRSGVQVLVDGKEWIDWKGIGTRLSLSEYWKTPHSDVLFLGAYDCRYRFLRIGLTPLSEKQSQPAAAVPDANP